MALLWGKDATPIFSDTGWEHAALYERLHVVESTLREIHGPDFEIVRVSRNGERLQDYIRDQKFFPSFRARFCTRMFKIEPIDNFLRQYEANISIAGRGGTFRYNNADHSIETGLLVAQNLLGDSHDVDAVNTELEYHEEKIVDRDGG